MRTLLVLGLMILAAPSVAQVETLVSFGTFADSNEFQTRIGGLETYEIECRQRDDLCIDNAGNEWGFGTNLPGTYVMLCGADVVVGTGNCVHLIRVVLKTTKRYREVVIEEQRNGCPVNAVYFDDRFLGSTEDGARGISANVKYGVGRLSKRWHTMSIEFANDEAICGQTDNPVTGIGISGVRR